MHAGAVIRILYAARDKCRIRQEGLAEGDKIRFAVLDEPFAAAETPVLGRVLVKADNGPVFRFADAYEIV